MNRLALLTLAIALFTASCGKTPSQTSAAGPAGMPPVAVRAVTALASDVPLDVSAIGNVEAISTVDVKARITAPILKLNFQEGQDVHQGELLFELDPETYIRQIAEIEADIARDHANEKQARANIEKDHATLRNAESIADRGRKLNKEGIFSREQTDQVVSNYEAAKASLDADQAALESAEAAINADDARMAQTKLLLGYTKVYAPISGRAGAVQVKAGNVVKENDTTLVTLLQVSPIYVSFSVPEDLLPEVRRYNSSRPLTVYADSADGSTNAGTLRFIDNTVDMTTGTIKLKAEFINSERKLWPGQFANVRARLNVERDRILVPSRTVQSGPRGKYVWVIAADSTASMRPVHVLRNYTPEGKGEQAVIDSGLKSGESVISEGQLRLAPGARVRLLQPNTAPGSASADRSAGGDASAG